MAFLLNHITFVRLIVFFVFLYSIFKLNRKNNTHLNLIIILSISFLTEISTIALFTIHSEKKINLLYSISFIFHHLFWLIIITSFPEFGKRKKLIIFSFLILSLINIVYFEKSNLNYLTFIVGALLYIMLFIYGSFNELRRDNFNLIYSNNFILLFSPILFLLGFSFMFGFRESKIRGYIVFNNTDLYTFISYFVNIIYYSFICLFIYKEDNGK